MGQRRNSDNMSAACGKEVIARKAIRRHQGSIAPQPSMSKPASKSCSWASHTLIHLGIYRRFERRLRLETHLADLQIGNL